MAIELTEPSTGPLDVAKSAGDELSEVDIETSGESEPLDSTAEPDAPLNNSAAGFEKEKNPLGYSITTPTENEIEELTDTDVDETDMEPKAY